MWAKAEVAQCSVSNCGLGVTPKVISLGVNFSVPTDQNFIPKASPPREEWLDLLQIREEKGIKMLDKQP